MLGYRCKQHWVAVPLQRGKGTQMFYQQVTNHLAYKTAQARGQSNLHSEFQAVLAQSKAISKPEKEEMGTSIPVQQIPCVCILKAFPRHPRSRTQLQDGKDLSYSRSLLNEQGLGMQLSSGWDAQHRRKETANHEPEAVAHVCNPSMRGAEVGRSLIVNETSQDTELRPCHKSRTTARQRVHRFCR